MPDYLKKNRTQEKVCINRKVSITCAPLKKKCPKCNGTGEVLDSREFGREMRRIREKRGYMMKSVAEEMGVSAPYLCQLEKGYREWDSELIEKFKLALK